MLNNDIDQADGSRILGRTLARELTPAEIDFISGARQPMCPNGTTICGVFGSGTEDDCSSG